MIHKKYHKSIIKNIMNAYKTITYYIYNNHIYIVYIVFAYSFLIKNNSAFIITSS